MEDTQIFVEGICGQEINWGCQFFGSPTMFWDVGKSRDEVSEIENFVRKKGDKPNNGGQKERKKGKQKNAAKSK